MSTTRRRQTMAPLVQGVSRLLRSVEFIEFSTNDTKLTKLRSPYFQLAEMRKKALGRDTKITLIHTMKAVVYDVQFNFLLDKIIPLVKFFDETNANTLVEDNNIDIVLSTFDMTDYRKSMADGIIAYNTGYGIKYGDIFWKFPSGSSVDEIFANNGYLTSTIDGKSVGNTTVFTNASGKDFWVSSYGIMPQTVTGLGTAPVINIGKTASAYSDIDSGLSLASANAAGKMTWRVPNANAVKIANGEALVVRVATAAILTTTYDFKVIVRGLYQ